MAKNNTKKKERQLPIPQLIVLVGIIMCLAPLVSDFIARNQANEMVTTMSDSASALGIEQKDDLLAQAVAYNARLGGYELDPADEPLAASITSDQILPYEEQLVTDSSSSLGWMHIPRANIKLPIYHGDDDVALSMGAGHHDVTSLPVGGERAAVWLEGHSGLRQSSLFDSVRVLEAGDVIGVNVLGDMRAWRVTSWEIVDPADIGSQQLSPTDGDTLTLVTCTTTPDRWNPKGRTGINDKRLLVHAERCEYDPAEFEQAEHKAATDPAVYVNEHTVQALYIVLLLLLLLIIFIISRLVKRRRARKKHQEAQL